MNVHGAFVIPDQWLGSTALMLLLWGEIPNVCINKNNQMMLNEEHNIEFPLIYRLQPINMTLNA